MSINHLHLYYTPSRENGRRGAGRMRWLLDLLNLTRTSEKIQPCVPSFGQIQLDHPTLCVGRNSVPAVDVDCVLFPAISTRPRFSTRCPEKVEEHLAIRLCRACSKNHLIIYKSSLHKIDLVGEPLATTPTQTWPAAFASPRRRKGSTRVVHSNTQVTYGTGSLLVSHASTRCELNVFGLLASRSRG